MTAVLRLTVLELRRTFALPSARVALLLGVLAPVVVLLLGTVSEPGAGPTAGTLTALVATAVPAGTVGAVVLGVVSVSSEYGATGAAAGTGRQITATLLAVPRRGRVVASKALAVAALVVGTALVAVPACLLLAEATTGAPPAPTSVPDMLGQVAGTAVHWTLMAALAQAITLLSRSGIVPLVVLVANSSVLSVSFLLSRATDAARFLPDLAGARLFGPGPLAVPDPLDALPGGLVMAAWALGLLLIAARVFARRPA